MGDCYISESKCSQIVTWLYQNSLLPANKQESYRDAVKSCSHMTVRKVRNILRSMGLLLVTGEKKNQSTMWNSCKAKPNPAMLAEIYRIYTNKSERRVKVIVREEKPKRLPSFEQALQALVELGYTGTLAKHTIKDGFTITETVVLSKKEVEE